MPPSVSFENVDLDRDGLANESSSHHLGPDHDVEEIRHLYDLAKRLTYRRCQAVSTARRLNRSRTNWTASEDGTPSSTAIQAKAVPVRPTPPLHDTSTRENKALLRASCRTDHASSLWIGSQKSGHCIQRTSEGISRRGGDPDITTARSGKISISLKFRKGCPRTRAPDGNSSTPLSLASQRPSELSVALLNRLHAQPPEHKSTSDQEVYSWGFLRFAFPQVEAGWGWPEAKKCPKRRRSIPGAAAPILTMQVIAPFPVGCRVGWSVDPLRFGHSGSCLPGAGRFKTGERQVRPPPANHDP